MAEQNINTNFNVIPISLNLNEYLNKSFDLVKYYYNELYFIEFKQSTIDSDVCLLLIGETGSGKTSFIELFLNFCQHEFNYSSYETQIFVKNEINGNSPIENPKTSENISKSSTQFAQVYTLILNKNNNRKIILIDTPGLGDTSGFIQDEENLDSICRVAEKLSIQNSKINITGILFFYNGQNKRLEILKNYIYESFKILFPKEIIIHVIATHLNDNISLSELTKRKTLSLDNPYKNWKMEQYYLNQKINENELPKEVIDELKTSQENEILKYKKIKENGEINFKKILLIISNYSIDLKIEDLVINYQKYREIKEIINNLETKMDNMTLYYQFLFNHVKKIEKIKEEKSGNKKIDYIKEGEKQVLKILKNEKYRFGNRESFLKSPNEYIVFCKICMIQAGFNAYVEIPKINPNCINQCKSQNEFKGETRYVFLKRNEKNNFEFFKGLQKVYKQYSTEKTDESKLIAMFEETNRETEEILNNKILEKLKSLIQSFQKDTMINNFYDFLNNKMNYLEEIKIKLNTSNKILLNFYNLQIKQYVKIIEIVYSDKFEELYKKINELKN